MLQGTQVRTGRLARADVGRADCPARKEKLPLPFDPSPMCFATGHTGRNWLCRQEGKWFCYCSDETLRRAEHWADRQSLCSWGSILRNEEDMPGSEVLRLKI